MSPLTNQQPRSRSFLKSQTARHEVKFPEYLNSNFSNMWETTDVRQRTQTLVANNYLHQCRKSIFSIFKDSGFNRAETRECGTSHLVEPTDSGCRLSTSTDFQLRTLKYRNGVEKVRMALSD
ncbi:Hypothetical_protein [Hexamita inflata]|uniref:Hypothetical_protein n=1 Tax=Hexamita inflata TaxID=28002 RepID=A0AA86UT25_9EUKA|nr:Hypothetical protein HINF_LOCUS36468 [Hexamita inflata]